MSGRMSRDKGARAERELVRIYREYGFEVDRNFGQENDTAEGFDVKTDVRGVDGIHVQSKRQETIHMPAWIQQTLDEAPEDSIPTVHFRRNHPKVPSEWWVALPLEDFLPLVRAWTSITNLKRAA